MEIRSSHRPHGPNGSAPDPESRSTILITGIAGRLAGLVARVLADRPDTRVLGVDRQPPALALPHIELHGSDMRGPQLHELLRATQPQTVIHLAQAGEEQDATVRGNVLLTMNLLSACVASGVRKVVLRSSTLVYGLRPDLPLFMPEGAALQPPATGLLRDYVEIERFAAGFARKQHGTRLVLLRCSGLVGAGVSSPLSRYLEQSLPRMALGFDPLIQVLHLEDAALVFALSALVPEAVGALNVAAEPPLALSQAIRLSGRQPAPLLPWVFGNHGLVGRLAAPLVGTVPYHPAFLHWPCLADTRRVSELLGFTPRRSALEAIQDAPLPDMQLRMPAPDSAA